MPVIKTLWIDSAKTFGAHVQSLITNERKLKRRNPLGFSQRIIDIINSYYKIDILNICNEITDNTKADIVDLLQRATIEQWSIDDVVARIGHGPLQKWRARRIARTETVTAANKGALIVANDSGLEMQKEWLAAYDHRTRHDHSMANGQNVPLDGFFKVGGFEMDAPGDRGGNGRPKVPASNIVNCRCTVLTLPVRDKNNNLIERDRFAFA